MLMNAKVRKSGKKQRRYFSLTNLATATPRKIDREHAIHATYACIAWKPVAMNERVP
jgi:hypothetical protein